MMGLQDIRVHARITSSTSCNLRYTLVSMYNSIILSGCNLVDMHYHLLLGCEWAPCVKPILKTYTTCIPYTKVPGGTNLKETFAVTQYMHMLHW